jgi:transcription termination/antitermination protein NusG
MGRAAAFSARLWWAALPCDISRAPAERKGCTKGGEALGKTTTDIERGDCGDCARAAGHAPWYALWTHSHCEQLVHDQLAHKGLHPFLPKVAVWSRRRSVRRLLPQPMFPGYLFLHHQIDKRAYIEVQKTRGLVRVLGDGWDRLIAVPDHEIEPIQKVAATGCPVFQFPYRKEGERARIKQGPLAGIEGVLVDRRPERGLLVLSVHLLQRSVAVTVDGTDVVPA